MGDVIVSEVCVFGCHLGLTELVMSLSVRCVCLATIWGLTDLVMSLSVRCVCLATIWGSLTWPVKSLQLLQLRESWD